MRMPYSLVVIGLWIAWAIYWSISASKVKATARRESFASRATHDVLIVIAGILVMLPPLPLAALPLPSAAMC